MNTYVRKRDALDAIDARLNEFPVDGYQYVGASIARQAIKNCPAADVVAVAGLTPCDACAYNPPSSGDGKPCVMCPARAKE